MSRLETAALERMGLAYDLDANDARRLKFLDRLDAYFWAGNNATALWARYFGVMR